MIGHRPLHPAKAGYGSFRSNSAQNREVQGVGFVSLE
jgi:hypothetical protein